MKASGLKHFNNENQMNFTPTQSATIYRFTSPFCHVINITLVKDKQAHKKKQVLCCRLTYDFPTSNGACFLHSQGQYQKQSILQTCTVTHIFKS